MWGLLRLWLGWWQVTCGIHSAPEYSLKNHRWEIIQYPSHPGAWRKQPWGHWLRKRNWKSDLFIRTLAVDCPIIKENISQGIEQLAVPSGRWVTYLYFDHMLFLFIQKWFPSFILSPKEGSWACVLKAKEEIFRSRPHLLTNVTWGDFLNNVLAKDISYGYFSHIRWKQHTE